MTADKTLFAIFACALACIFALMSAHTRRVVHDYWAEDTDAGRQAAMTRSDCWVRGTALTGMIAIAAQIYTLTF